MALFNLFLGQVKGGGGEGGGEEKEKVNAVPAAGRCENICQ